MRIESSLTDPAVVAELGRRLASLRINQGLTQVQLAFQAGVSRNTVDRIEAGEPAQLVSFIRILRTLGCLDALDGVLPAPGPTPMDLLKLKVKVRRRAPRAKPAAKPRAPWSWGDDA